MLKFRRGGERVACAPCRLQRFQLIFEFPKDENLGLWSQIRVGVRMWGVSVSEKFTGHGIVGPMAAPGPADFYDCLTANWYPPKNSPTSALKIDFSRFSNPKCAKSPRFQNVDPSVDVLGAGRKGRWGRSWRKWPFSVKKMHFALMIF